MNNPHQYCQAKVAQSGSSFYYSFLFLPPEQKKAIMAVYAFCREVDDIVDECRDKTIAHTKLNWWEAEIERTFNKKPMHPVGRALTDLIPKYKLNKSLFSGILHGMRMDLKKQRYKTFEELRLYSHCVASTVGMLAAKIFGFENKTTLEYARYLGIAFQLVNIIRDVGEDARRNRIYIPEKELEQFDVPADHILQRRVSNRQNFQQLMSFQAKRARHYYSKALDLLPASDRLNQRSGLIMAKIYFTLLDEIESCQFEILHQRVGLTPLRKLWIAWKTARAEKKFVPQPLETHDST